MSLSLCYKRTKLLKEIKKWKQGPCQDIPFTHVRKFLSIMSFKIIIVHVCYLQNISPGMKLWGVIAEVNEKDLVISLPGGLRGLVRATDALDNEVEVLSSNFYLLIPHTNMWSFYIYFYFSSCYYNLYCSCYY